LESQSVDVAPSCGVELVEATLFRNASVLVLDNDVLGMRQELDCKQVSRMEWQLTNQLTVVCRHNDGGPIPAE